jgi:hypothetical protein
MFALSVVLWPCTCGPGTYAPACESFFSAGAVFLGTVLDHNDDGSGRFTQWTAYLVRVDESFKGLDSSQQEVFIDPGSYSSCYRDYQVGKQYLFVAGGPAAFAAMSIVGERGTRKPFPVRWETKRNLKVYSAAGCSPTRDATRAVEDIAWLRTWKKGETKTRVYGLALQNFDAFYRPPRLDQDVPLPGARITLMSSGRQIATIADSDGRYSFDGIPEGSYSLVAEKAPWTSSLPMTFQLHAGGCAKRDLSLGTDGIVEGTALDHQGNPVHRLRVELVQVLAGGGVSNVYTAWSDTDQSGRFHFNRVAAGTFVLGVNIASAPTDEEPYIGTYYPGVQNVSDAHRFNFQPNSNTSGLVLRLPPPLNRRKVKVHVYWADGTPVNEDARAFAEYQGHRAAQGNAMSGNVVELVLIEGLDYNIDADWFSLSGAPVHHVVSGKVKLAAGRGPATLDIRLNSPRP